MRFYIKMAAILTENPIMQRETQLKSWLQQQFPGQEFALEFAAADADFRRYFRARFADGRSIVCMDAPPDKMDTEPYVRVREIFSMLNVPQILARDEKQGFIALNDLGKVQYLAAMQHDTQPETHKALLLKALDELIILQKASRPGVLPEYSRDILLREAGGGLRYYGNLPGSYGARSTINPPFLAYGAGFGEEALQAYFVAMQRALEPEQR